MLKGVCINLAQNIAKRYRVLLKMTDSVLVTLLAVAILVLRMVFIVMIAMVFAQLGVKIPRVTDCALMAGNAHGGDIKVHIDSGASRHFISDVRLFVSWDEEVPNITFNTASCVPVTAPLYKRCMYVIGLLCALRMVYKHTRPVIISSLCAHTRGMAWIWNRNKPHLKYTSMCAVSCILMAALRSSVLAHVL